MGESALWYAVSVRTRHEKAVAFLLGNKGYATFLPLYEARRRCCDRVSHLFLPLFPGYVFCQFDARFRLPILTTSGVMQIAGNGRVPIPVEPSELDAVRAIIRSGLPSEPWLGVRAGDYVRIAFGALAGLEGIVLRAQGKHRLVVMINLIQRGVAVEIEGECVEHIRHPQAPLTTGLGRGR